MGPPPGPECISFMVDPLVQVITLGNICRPWPRVYPLYGGSSGPGHHIRETPAPWPRVYPLYGGSSGPGLHIGTPPGPECIPFMVDPLVQVITLGKHLPPGPECIPFMVDPLVQVITLGH